MKAKSKARKIFKNLRQEKLNELLKNETQSDNTKYLDKEKQVEGEIKEPETKPTDTKESKDKTSQLGKIEGNITQSNNINDDFKEYLDKENEINETLNDFKDDNSIQFKKQSKQLVKINSKLDKFEQKIFHSQGGIKTALPQAYGKTKDFFTNRYTPIDDSDKERANSNIKNDSNLLGMTLGVITSVGINAFSNLKDWWRKNDNIETQSIDDENKSQEISNLDKEKPKQVEGEVKKPEFTYTPPTKREIEKVRDDNLLSEIIEAENNGSETPSYLKEKKSLLSYIPFLDTKPTYELSDEFKEKLNDDDGQYLESKKHLLAKLKTRDDVNKDDLKFLENQVEKTTEKRKERDTKVHSFSLNGSVHSKEVEEAFPEYREKYEKLSDDYRLKEIVLDRARNNLDRFYFRKYALFKDPSKALVKNYYGEVLSPKEYLNDSKFIEPYLNEYKTETELLDEDPEVNEKKLDEIEANSKSRYDEIQNQQKFLNELRQKSAEKEALKLDKEATINPPKPETTQSVDDTKTIETNSLDTTNLKPIQPTPEKPKETQNIEGSVKPANVSSNEVVSQSEANTSENEDKKEQEATSSSPASVSTPSVSSPSQSAPASVTQSAPQSPQVQLSNSSKNLAEKTVGTEPKPDTITNEKVINNQVVQKTPENNFNKFNKAQLNEDEDKYLRGE